MNRNVDALSIYPPLASGRLLGLRRRITTAVAITTRAVLHAGRALAQWRARRRELARDRWSKRKEWELRRQEELYARATDLHELERMQRDFDRRDAGGLRDWEWR